jgi:hypothetical protein
MNHQAVPCPSRSRAVEGGAHPTGAPMSRFYSVLHDVLFFLILVLLVVGR